MVRKTKRNDLTKRQINNRVKKILEDKTDYKKEMKKLREEIKAIKKLIKKIKGILSK